MLQRATQGMRFGGADGENVLAKARFQIRRRVAEQQLAQVHQCDAMTALRFI